jgi:FKBP-type peptidyl-prolyl cis-trans isomerase
MKKLSFFLFLILLSCSSNVEPVKEIDWSKEKSMELNKTIAEEEKIAIKLFLAQHSDWKLTSTGTGLQYYIYETNDGQPIKVGSVIDVKYKVTQLDGTVCYETGEDEVLEVEVDHSQVETGLQEGLKKMKVGDKAKMIIPSHLAHGITGDLNKIPPLTPLIIDIQVTELIK